MILAHGAALAVRYLLVVLFFPFSALDKILNFDGAVGQAQSLFKARPIAVGLIAVGLAVEILMPIGILTGIADRLAAFIMAGYCGVTAILFKQFWQPGDFWAKGQSKGRDLFWDFLKNFSLAGGFLLITVGLSGAGCAAFLAHPLGSSHPYAAPTSSSLAGGTHG
ncbi:DoxX family membrane protein [Acidisoma sp. C75]